MEFNRRVQKARQEFINKIPENCLNTKETATSTLACQDDIWGDHDEHYRWVNCRDEKGNLIPRLDPETSEPMMDGEGNPKYEKSLELIGKPHIQWDQHLVQIRVSKDSSQWFKHWPVAAELFLIGKLDEAEKPWLIEEGAERFITGKMPVKNTEGKFTRGIQALLKLGIVKNIGDQVKLSIDAENEDAKEADVAAKELVAAQPQVVEVKAE